MIFDRRLSIASCLLGGALFCSLFSGCGQTQVATSNRKLLASLQTAVSARNSEWLKATSLQLTEKRDRGELSTAEFQALNAIILKAERGEWKEAQQEVFALSEGQRPTADDRTRVQRRQRK